MALPGRSFTLGLALIWILGTTPIAYGASRDETSVAAFRSTISLDGPWQISPIQRANKRPDEAILSSWVPTSSLGESLNWSSIVLPTVRGMYEAAPASVFPQDPKKSYWFGAFREPTYNWAWYQRTFALPKIPADSRVYICFTSVAWESRVWINGKPVGSHLGSFTGFDLDITDAIHAEGENSVTLLVVADFGERPVRHTYGKMFYPAANMAGIIGPVAVETRPSVFVARSLIAAGLDHSVTVEDWIENRTPIVKNIQLRSVVSGSDGTILNPGQKDIPLQIDPGLTKYRHRIATSDSPLWSPGNPRLCTLHTAVLVDNETVDRREDRFGFRDFSIKNGRFFLNGERIRLYYGNILTFGNFDFFNSQDQDRFRKWLRRQKEQQVNTIRYHMGGVDSFMMLRICDEEGMLVIDEWPWFHRVEGPVPEGPARNEFFRNNDAEMEAWLYRDFNSPSNVLWSLSNEVWTKGEIPLLSHTYEQMKQLDWSGRPMSADSGFHSVIRNQTVPTDVVDFHNYSTQSDYPWSLLGESIEADFAVINNLYGQKQIPVIVSESLNILPIPKTAIPKITPEAYVQNSKISGVREIGLNAATNPQGGTKTLVSTFGIRVLEKFRQDTRLQGFSPWFENRSWLPEEIAQIYGPYYIGACDLPSHVESGKPWKVEVVAIRDALRQFSGQITFRVEDETLKILWEKTADIALSASEESVKEDFTWQVPVAQTDGKATLKLELRSRGKILAVRHYPLLVFEKEQPRISIASGRRVGIWKTPSDASRLPMILRDLKLDIPVIQDVSALSVLDILILPNGWDSKTLPDWGVLRSWMEEGGRLIAFESRLNEEIPWAPGYKLLCTAKTRQPFVDIVSPNHPIFSRLAPDCFDAWNGKANLVTDTLIQPISANALAAAGSYGSTGQLSAVVEASVGMGSFLLSLLQAVDRYDSDPVAARYVRNILDYALAGNPADLRPLAMSEKNETLAKTANASAAQYAPIDIRPFVNKPLSHTLGDLTTLDYSQLPIGNKRFLGIPFEVIDPSQNQDRAVLVMQGNYTPQLPQRVEGISVHSKASHLCFLQAAYHAGTRAMGHYIIHYDDGTTLDVPLNGSNLGDWFNSNNLKNAFVGWSENLPGTATEVGLFVFPWENPYLEKVIKTIDVLSEGAEQESGASLLLIGITVRKP